LLRAGGHEELAARCGHDARPSAETVLACRMRTAGGNNLWRKEEIPAGKQVSEEIHQAHGLRLTPKKSRRTAVKSDRGKRKSRSQRS
jgi:hypothetical protein